MAKFKHNKKRNTAFLYETIVLELTKAILKSDEKSKGKISNLIKESFRYGTHLHRELKLYHALTKTKNVNPLTAEKILLEVKRNRADLDNKKLLSEQNKLAARIKKTLSDEIMSNFVPDYKTLATISQIFSKKPSIKTKILLENEIIGQMSISKNPPNKKMVPIDNIIYKTFVKKFNQEYSNTLGGEQKKLLNKYVSSFSDNGLELKVYLNEEVGRLKSVLNKSLLIEEFVADNEMQEKAKSVLSILNSYKNTKPSKEMVQQVIKIQELVK